MRYTFIAFLLSCFASASYGQFCSGTTTLTDCSGEFDDGSGNQDYENNSDCSWLISVMPDSTIILTFNSFETQSCCDFLKVYDGSSSSAPLIGEYSGDELPNPIISNSNELFLEFTSDESFTMEGWSASYACLNDSIVDLTYDDPGFPRILSADGPVLEYEFNLENSGTLGSGPFEIRFYASEDEEIEPSDHLLFTELIDSLPAKSSEVVSGIRNVRDSIAPGTYRNLGFIIDPENEIEELSENNNTHLEDSEYLDIPFCSEMTKLTGCQGTIDDGSGFEDVIRETQCSWLLESENNESLFLYFSSVDLSNSATIRIYDGDDQNAPLIHEFRGNDDFYPVVSSENSIFFEFDNGGSSVSQGWNAEYFCTDTTIANLILESSSDANSPGSVIDFELEIRNNGNTASPSTKVYFFGSLDNDFDISEDFIIDSVELPPIPAFGQISLTHSTDSRAILPSGEYYPVAVIDPFQRVDELFKEDNAKVFYDRFHIPYCADTTTVLEDCSGIVSDGSGNQDFTPGSDCSWQVSADSGQYVSLSLLNADLGSSPNSLRLYDGENGNSPLIAEFAGHTDDEIPSNIRSRGEHIYIEFVTPSSNTFGSGWDFQYDCTEDMAVNFDFVDDNGLVNTFNDQIRYNIDVRNFGNRPTPESKIYFFISPDQSINSNDIIVDSAVLPPVFPYTPNNVIRTIDLSLLPASIPGGEYYAGFYIDPLDEVEEMNEDDNNYIDNRDFSIPYCPEELQLIDDCFGTITDGSGNSNYIDDSDCMWLIEGPPGSTINLSFNSFNTESCCDFVRVYDGNSNSSFLLGEYSGSTLPPNLQTTGNSAYIEFETDGSLTRSGWELEYECIQFFSNLKFKNGSPQVQVVDNNLNFAAIIENDGALPTGEFQLGFILSENQIPNIGDFLLASETINSLEPDQEVEYSTAFDLRELDIPAGKYYLIARLDVDEVVEENDEMDNDFISAFPIDIISSVRDRLRESEIKIFPFNQHIIIQNPLQHHMKRIRLIRADGVVLQNQKVNNSNSEHRLNVTQYPGGVYIVVIDLKDQILVKKVFIP